MCWLATAQKTHHIIVVHNQWQIKKKSEKENDIKIHFNGGKKAYVAKNKVAKKKKKPKTLPMGVSKVLW